MADDELPVPDAAAAMNAAMRNCWGVWSSDIIEDWSLWDWGDDPAPAKIAAIVMDEITNEAITNIGAGPDGIAVISIGILDFEHSLCVELPFLVANFIETNEDFDDRLHGESADEALRLAVALERQAAVLRAAVSPDPVPLSWQDEYYLSCGLNG